MFRRSPTLLLAAIAAAAALGVTGCGTVGGSAHAQADPTPIGVDGQAPAAPGAPAPGAPAGGTQGGGSSAGGSSGGGQAPAPAPGKGGSAPAGGGSTAPAAKVTALRVAQQPSCPIQGTTDAPFSKPGTDVKIAWTVTGAAGAAIAVDNPGTYGAYGSDFPASGSMSFAFPCEAKGTTKHTYTVWPAGVKDAPKSITVSASADG
jgi:hypothetical protein